MTDDPLALLASALPGVPGQEFYFPSIALATVDEHGHPDLRTVLLSAITAEGLVFHTDSRTRKVAQLHRKPSVALMLSMPERGRQIVVRGTVSRQDQFGSAAAYRARTPYLQLLAWLNTPDMAELPLSDRHHRWREFAASNPPATLRPPAEWVGFVVRPDRVTFWQGDVQGPSHRTEYTRAAAGWSTALLPG